MLHENGLGRCHEHQDDSRRQVSLRASRRELNRPDASFLSQPVIRLLLPDFPVSGSRRASLGPLQCFAADLDAALEPNIQAQLGHWPAWFAAAMGRRV